MANSIKRTKTGKGWTLMGTYRTELFALRKAKSRSHAFSDVAVVTGKTHPRIQIMGQPKTPSTTVHRVWVK